MALNASGSGSVPQGEAAAAAIAERQAQLDSLEARFREMTAQVLGSASTPVVHLDLNSIDLNGIFGWLHWPGQCGSARS